MIVAVRKNKFGVYYFSVRIKDRDGTYRQKKVENKNWKTRKEALSAEQSFLSSLDVAKDNMKYCDVFNAFIS
jgi:hypothetical protein